LVCACSPCSLFCLLGSEHGEDTTLKMLDVDLSFALLEHRLRFNKYLVTTHVHAISDD
jgi:hypothetical protein